MLVRALLIWGVLLILEGIVVILLVPPTLIVNAAYKEEAVLSETLGSDVAESISVRSKDTFNSWFVDTGVMAESFNLFVPTEASKRQSVGLETLAEGLFEMVRRRLEAAWNLIFVGIQRFYAFGIWFPLLLPFLVACAFDGATLRRVKLLTFGISSAPIYGAAVHSLIILAFFPLYYAAWPFAAHPLLVPIWFIAIALALRTMIANLQRM
jgi:hypothetical protein